MLEVLWFLCCVLPCQCEYFWIVAPCSVLTNALLCQVQCVYVLYRTRGFVRDLGGTALGMVCPTQSGLTILGQWYPTQYRQTLCCVRSTVCRYIMEHNSLSAMLEVLWLLRCVLPLPTQIFLNCGTLLSIDESSAVSGPLCVCALQNTGIVRDLGGTALGMVCPAQSGLTILGQWYPSQYCQTVYCVRPPVRVCITGHGALSAILEVLLLVWLTCPTRPDDLRTVASCSVSTNSLLCQVHCV